MWFHHFFFPNNIDAMLATLCVGCVPIDVKLSFSRLFQVTMSDQGEKTCPLCAEEMDLTDQQLKPCKCGYEV